MKNNIIIFSFSYSWSFDEIFNFDVNTYLRLVSGISILHRPVGADVKKVVVLPPPQTFLWEIFFCLESPDMENNWSDCKWEFWRLLHRMEAKTKNGIFWPKVVAGHQPPTTLTIFFLTSPLSLLVNWKGAAVPPKNLAINNKIIDYISYFDFLWHFMTCERRHRGFKILLGMERGTLVSMPG